jgi:hypothetical protein
MLAIPVAERAILVHPKEGLLIQQVLEETNNMSNRESSREVSGTAA